MYSAKRNFSKFASFPTMSMDAQHTSEALRKPRHLLITKAQDTTTDCPYALLAEKYGVMVDFQPLTTAQPISVAAFRKYKQQILDHTVTLFSSRVAMDHFFQLADQVNLKLPLEGRKYLCTTDRLMRYLQKYVACNRRRVFSGKDGFAGLAGVISRNKKAQFLLPCSETSGMPIVRFFKQKGYKLLKLPIYKIVAHTPRQLAVDTYDVITFFSPQAVQAFQKLFPKFEPGHTKLAAFGTATWKALEQVGWQVAVKAPSAEAPSMATALDAYLKAAPTLS